MVFYSATMAACTSSMSIYVQLGNIWLVSWTMVPRGSLIVGKFPKIMHEFHPNIIHYLIMNIGRVKLMPILLIHIMIQTNAGITNEVFSLPKINNPDIAIITHLRFSPLSLDNK